MLRLAPRVLCRRRWIICAPVSDSLRASNRSRWRSAPASVPPELPNETRLKLDGPDSDAPTKCLSPRDTGPTKRLFNIIRRKSAFRTRTELTRLKRAPHTKFNANDLEKTIAMLRLPIQLQRDKSHPISVPEPEGLNSRQFLGAVRKLTSGYEPRRLIRRRLEDSGLLPRFHDIVHIRRVSNDLVALFEARGPESIKGQSIHVACDYLIEHTQWNELGRLLTSLAARDVALPTITFNMFLQATTEPKALAPYRSLLPLLARLRFQPDYHTWAILFQLVRNYSPDRSREVASEMESLGLLETPSPGSFKMLVARHVVAHDFESWLRTHNGDIIGFFASCDQRWHGCDWISVQAANQIIQVTASRGLFRWSNQVLDEVMKRQCKLNNRTLNILLGACAVQQNVQAAVSFVSRLLPDQTSSMPPNADTYGLLWHLAWTRKSANLLRVVWRHACMKGHVSYRMQNHTKLAIRRLDHQSTTPRSAPASKASQSHIRKAVSLRLALGVLDIDSQDRNEKPVHKTSPVTEGGAFKEQGALRLMDDLLEKLYSDLQTAGRYRPRLPLAAALNAAFALDIALKRQGVTDDFNHMLACAVPVEVKPRVSRSSGIQTNFNPLITE